MRAINAKTQLIGLIGWPISHSLSPAIHNAAAAALDLNWVYVPLPVRAAQVETAVKGLPALGFRGVNVTVPHKQAVMPFLDEINPAAEAIGAVNTIVVDQNGRLVGHNTDWSGFLDDLEAADVHISERDCLVLGAGGAARAAAYGLARAGCKVQVLARRLDQAIDLVADLVPYIDDAALFARPLQRLETAVAQSKAPLIVNTTPAGMAPNVDQSVWPDALPFPDGAFVVDLVYNPPTTRLLRQAQAAGIPAANGLGMLLRQGARSFSLWTGQDPDIEVMAQALETNYPPGGFP